MAWFFQGWCWFWLFRQRLVKTCASTYVLNGWPIKLVFWNFLARVMVFQFQWILSFARWCCLGSRYCPIWIFLYGRCWRFCWGRVKCKETLSKVDLLIMRQDWEEVLWDLGSGLTGSKVHWEEWLAFLFMRQIERCF
jgi:hypothetical protein